MSRDLTISAFLGKRRLDLMNHYKSSSDQSVKYIQGIYRTVIMLSVTQQCHLVQRELTSVERPQSW